MWDLQVTSGIDVQPDDRGDLPVVTGRDAYNQTIALGVMDFFYNEIGSLDKDAVISKLQNSAKGIAAQFPEYIQDIHTIRAYFGDEAETEAIVEVTYLTGENFSFGIQ